MRCSILSMCIFCSFVLKSKSGCLCPNKSNSTKTTQESSGNSSNNHSNKTLTPTPLVGGDSKKEEVKKEDKKDKDGKSQDGEVKDGEKESKGGYIYNKDVDAEFEKVLKIFEKCHEACPIYGRDKKYGTKDWAKGISIGSWGGIEHIRETIIKGEKISEMNRCVIFFERFMGYKLTAEDYFKGMANGYIFMKQDLENNQPYMKGLAEEDCLGCVALNNVQTYNKDFRKPEVYYLIFCVRVKENEYGNKKCGGKVLHTSWIGGGQGWCTGESDHFTGFTDDVSKAFDFSHSRDVFKYQPDE